MQNQPAATSIHGLFTNGPERSLRVWKLPGIKEKGSRGSPNRGHHGGSQESEEQEDPAVAEERRAGRVGQASREEDGFHSTAV